LDICELQIDIPPEVSRLKEPAAVAELLKDNSAKVNAAGADETCTGVLCDKDHYVDWSTITDKKCTACPAGKSITYGGAAGKGQTGKLGDASFKATVCHATVCAADYHVVKVDATTGAPNAGGVLRCRKCNSWETNAAGDALTGGDAKETTCNPSVCGNANEYVKADHTCATCPAWEAPNDAAKSRATVTTTAIKCKEIKCQKDEYVAVTGTCKSKDGNGARGGNDCGSDNQQPCNTKALCEASAAVPAYWTKTNAVCTACGAGKFRTAGDSLSLAASTVCSVKAHDDAKHDLLPLCKKDEHVHDHKCVPCKTGHTNVAGDDPNRPTNTACTPFVTPKNRADCAKDQHVVNHKCVACPPGTTNQAGDDHGGHDTRCEAILCKANERVQDHKCVPCNPVTDKDKVTAGDHTAGHLTNTAGDDASKGNTQCYAL